MRSPPPIWIGVSLAHTSLWGQMLLSTELPEPQPARELIALSLFLFLSTGKATGGLYKMLMHTQNHKDRNIRNVFWGAADAAFEEWGYRLDMPTARGPNRHPSSQGYLSSSIQ